MSTKDDIERWLCSAANYEESCYGDVINAGRSLREAAERCKELDDCLRKSNDHITRVTIETTDALIERDADLSELRLARACIEAARAHAKTRYASIEREQEFDKALAAFDEGSKAT